MYTSVRIYVVLLSMADIASHTKVGMCVQLTAAAVLVLINEYLVNHVVHGQP